MGILLLVPRVVASKTSFLISCVNSLPTGEQTELPGPGSSHQLKVGL